jgi:hypothetical protein
MTKARHNLHVEISMRRRRGAKSPRNRFYLANVIKPTWDEVCDGTGRRALAEPIERDWLRQLQSFDGSAALAEQIIIAGGQLQQSIDD